MSAPAVERRGGPFFLLTGAAAVLGWAACSSGLEGVDPRDTQDIVEPPENTNLRFGFELPFELSQPVTDVEVAGGVVPTLTGSRERPVAIYAFVTAATIADVDDLTTDANGVEDVFLAAVDTTRIDTRAFVYGMASTMRHTRCVTCHQMNIDVVADPTALPPTPFLTQDHFSDGTGAPPLNDFRDENCKGCHFADWFSPGPTFDLRRVGTRDLFLRAQIPPGGLDVHFRTDARVLWALDSGDTPFGGAADDDHDGIDEPEDHDGTRRHAPGGKEAFLRRLDGLLETADPVTGELLFSSAEAAVQDVVLASRAAAGNQAANGPARGPSLVYVPNPAFDPATPTLFAAGTVHVAFESDASDMVGGNANGATDVYRETFDLFLTADGELDLVHRAASQVLVSESSGGGDANGRSTDPDIGGDGSRIAFVSEAFDLVAGMPMSCRPEVYLWDALGGIDLVSHVPGSAIQPGDAGAIAPDLSADGQAVCFESDATDLVLGDTNGARDVFYAVAPGLVVERASVDDAGLELATHSHAGSIFHAGGEVKVAFASRDVALPPVLAVQCPDVVVVLSPVRDTHLRLNAPNTNFNDVDPPPSPPGSSGEELYVGWTGTVGDERRSLVAFDVSAIPAGSTINSVQLAMTVDQVPGPGTCPAPVNLTANLHRVTANWVETTVTWNSLGSSFIASPSAGLVIDGNLGQKTWTTTAQLVADVQGWVDSGSNFGWLVDGSLSTLCTVRRFDSRNDQSPPSLRIDYSPPPPPLAPLLGGPVVSTVYLRDTALARTFDLNGIVDPEGTAAAREIDVDGTTPLAANATSPVISPYGTAVMFESMAQNIDRTRPDDLNREMDVVLVDLLQLDSQGFVLPYRVSVTAEGGDANGPSHAPRFGAFTPRTDAFPHGIALYATQATNLANSDPGDLDGDGDPEFDNFVTAFLSEGGAVVADFEAEPARQGQRRGVRFRSRSSGEPETFTWDFGDGTPTSSAAEPVHAYETPGLYTVSLTVDGPLGSDTRTRTEYVHVLDAVMPTFTSTKDASSAPPQAPAADVPFGTPVAGAIDDADPASALRFDLDSTGTTEFPDEFEWTLRRNGGGPTVVSTDASPEDVRIDRVGSYDLTLEATGPGGSGTATQRIDVFQRVVAAFDTAPSGPIVRGPASLDVQFTDTSSGDLLDAGAHLWTFGDGATSTEANPAHTYAEGVYFARLTVSGKGTDSSTTSTVAVIADGTITSAFRVVPQPAGSVAGVIAGEAVDPAGGVLVDFTSESQHALGTPLSFRWDFGTGAATGQETVEDPTGILYAVANPENVQSFFVSLVASTTAPAPATCFGQPAGTCDERIGTLIVYPRPQVSFAPPAPSFASSPLRPPHTVQLSGTVVGDGVGTDPEYRWLRSEVNQAGATIPFAAGLAPVHEFEDPGVYEVVLEVETNGPGGTRQVVQSPPVDVAVTASTFSDWYMQAIDPASGARCTNCHKGANPPAGLDWLGTPAEVYERIVEDAEGNPILSTRCNQSRRRIEPFAPENSAVYNVLLRPPGPLCAITMRVNLPGDEADKDAHVAKLRSWIMGGALND